MNNYVFMGKNNCNFNIWYSRFKNVGESAELHVLSFLVKS